MGPRKSKKTAPKSKRSEEAAADSNPKKKAKSEPAPAAREPDVHKMKWDHLWKEFAEADNPGEMTLEGFADLLEKADIDCTSAPALVLCWKLDFKLRNSSQVVQHDDYSGYFRFDRETVGGLKRELETSRFDAASLDIDEFRCECARARAKRDTRAHTHARSSLIRRVVAAQRVLSLRVPVPAPVDEEGRRARPARRGHPARVPRARDRRRERARRVRDPIRRLPQRCTKIARLAAFFSSLRARACAASRSSKETRTRASPSTSGRSSSSSP